MDNTPLVTIYITTKNRIQLLERAINSAVNQDYENIEIIIVDDGSIDGTMEYLANKSRANTRIKYLVNTTSLGACASRNRAIFSATGEFITGLDDDDYFLPNRISDFMHAWHKKSETTIALCSDTEIKISIRKTKTTRRPKTIKRHNLIDANLVGNQVFTKTKTLIEHCGFDINFPAWQDLELWYRLLALEHSQIKCTNQKTYITDMSHPHERISTKKIDRIEEAHKLFSEKHSLLPLEREILSVQLSDYDNRKQRLTTLAKKIYRSPTKENLRKILGLTVRRLLKRKTYKNNDTNKTNN